MTHEKNLNLIPLEKHGKQVYCRLPMEIMFVNKEIFHDESKLLCENQKRNCHCQLHMNTSQFSLRANVCSV